jgi:hypothetical protein
MDVLSFPNVMLYQINPIAATYDSESPPKGGVHQLVYDSY